MAWFDRFQYGTPEAMADRLGDRGSPYGMAAAAANPGMSYRGIAPAGGVSYTPPGAADVPSIRAVAPQENTITGSPVAPLTAGEMRFGPALAARMEQYRGMAGRLGAGQPRQEAPDAGRQSREHDAYRQADQKKQEMLAQGASDRDASMAASQLYQSSVGQSQQQVRPQQERFSGFQQQASRFGGGGRPQPMDRGGYRGMASMRGPQQAWGRGSDAGGYGRQRQAMSAYGGQQADRLAQDRAAAPEREPVGELQPQTEPPQENRRMRYGAARRPLRKPAPQQVQQEQPATI